jgi:general secretion pathway protein B
MSFILDALRKSETQRQRQAAPSLAEAQYHVNEKQRSIWFPILLAVLAVNLVILAYVFLGNSRDADDNALGTGSPPPGRVELRPASPAEEAPVTTEARSRKPLSAELVKPATPTVLPAEPAVNSGDFATNPDSSALTSKFEPVPELGNLPRMQQLITSGQLSLSPLHIDIHVYAGNPEKRFIFINMNKYREGDQLEEGPMVEEITNTGVILGHQGNRFTLDRE